MKTKCDRNIIVQKTEPLCGRNVVKHKLWSKHSQNQKDKTKVREELCCEKMNNFTAFSMSQKKKKFRFLPNPN